MIVENFEFNVAQLTFKVVQYFLTHPVWRWHCALYKN